ncbi:MAG TPA: putative toxin-antitoxin system toxin component, PIN family [Ferruginibacter sp.]|nr:putative toxin-antitoxin system toxin component, PIN family [Ferruginibacter sp.]
MPSKRNRIIIDTNLWISFLLTRDHLALDKIFSASNSILLFSEELLEEFIEVANRPKFKKYFSLKDLQEIIIQIKVHGEFIDVKSSTIICRDPKDNFLLSLSKDGNATHLISGDKDLLDLKRFGRTKIVTLKKYLSEL